MNLARLAKVWALTTSSAPGEAAAARAQAQRIVERAGKTLADVPGLLGQAPQQPKPAPFTFVDIGTPEGRAAYAAQAARHKAARDRREAPERAEVLQRYGTAEAALAWTMQEVQLRSAVRPWSTFQRAPNNHRTAAVDGWTLACLTNPPQRVLDALADAYSLPATIAEAATVYQAWQRRDRDLGLVLGDTTDTQLDLHAYLRGQIVEQLLATELRATTLADVLARQRYLVDLGWNSPKIEQAVLLDLEHLAGMASAPPVQSGQVSTSPKARRAEVLQLLSNVDTARLTDREIARRVGVSPQTVGNLRRKGAA